MLPKSILLVEDNSDDVLLAMRTLVKAGIVAITVARDGQDALDLLMDLNQPLPEIVLLDLRLPVIDGLEMLALLRRQERTKSLPVFIYSSFVAPDDEKVCNLLGVAAFLDKPLELCEFQQVLSTLPVMLKSTNLWNDKYAET